MDNYGGNLNWQDYADDMSEEELAFYLAREAAERKAREAEAEKLDPADFGLGPEHQTDDIPF